MSRRTKRLHQILSRLDREGRRARELNWQARRLEHKIRTASTVRREYVSNHIRDTLRYVLKRFAVAGTPNTPYSKRLFVTLMSQILLETANHQGVR